MPTKNEQKIADIIKKIDKATTPTNADLKATGEEIVESIVQRTRAGYGVTKQVGGKQTRLKRLSKSYTDQRKGKLQFFTKDGRTFPVKNKKGKKTIKKPNLSKTTTPGRSNLTATGQLLESLFYKTRKIGFGLIIIALKEGRGADLFGNPPKVNNSEITQFQRKAGREYLGLSKTQKRRVQDNLSKRIRERVRKLLS